MNNKFFFKVNLLKRTSIKIIKKKINTRIPLLS